MLYVVAHGVVWFSQGPRNHLFIYLFHNIRTNHDTLLDIDTKNTKLKEVSHCLLLRKAIQN